MMTKVVILSLALVGVCSAGIIPFSPVPAVPAFPTAALAVGTYATNYNAHTVNHAFAAPFAASLPAFAGSPFTPYTAAFPGYPTFPFAPSPNFFRR